MRLLLDTHVILWWLGDDRRLGLKSRLLLEDIENHVLVSIVSIWEIVMKARAGKLNANLGDIERALTAQGFASLGIEKRHLQAVTTLPIHHGDPFDHMLLAQAQVEGATLLTADGILARYPVPCLDCGQ